MKAVTPLSSSTPHAPPLRVFTTLLVKDNEVALRARHRARLDEGARAFDLVWDGDLDRALADVPRDGAAWRVRITLRAGEDPLVETAPYVAPHAPWTLCPVPAGAVPATVRMKTTARDHYEAARRRMGGADDALLIGHKGEVWETTTANLFVRLAGGVWATPPADQRLLPGVARAALLAKRPEIAEKPLFLADLAAADAIVVTNALFGVHAVGRIVGLGSFASDALASDL